MFFYSYSIREQMQNLQKLIQLYFDQTFIMLPQDERNTTLREL